MANNIWKHVKTIAELVAIAVSILTTTDPTKRRKRKLS